MKMTEGIEWAIHCCTLLAHVPEGRALPRSALSEFFEVPQTYLAKHLQHLSRAGIVIATKGPGGGYALARPADKVTLLQIVEAIEGRDPCFQCTEIRQRGPSAVANDASYKKPCGIHTAMLKAEQAWRRELGAVSIADMNADAERNVSGEQMSKAAAWLQDALR